MLQGKDQRDGERRPPRTGAKQHKRADIAGPVLMFLALLLLGALVALLYVPIFADRRPGVNPLAQVSGAHLFLTTLVLIFAFPLLLGFVASLRRLRGRERAAWVEVSARCIDRHLRPVVNYYDEGEEHGWSYRLLCDVEFHGQTYRVHADGRIGPRFHLFPSPQAAAAFLDQEIEPDGACRLLVNARDPEEARFAVDGAAPTS